MIEMLLINFFCNIVKLQNLSFEDTQIPDNLALLIVNSTVNRILINSKYPLINK